ncbi:hypothetical protein L2719_17755 [Shewanella schlegeliana]|uniref:Uncharacterized protein n=1 Tax=Shewanella schlegeliana TaxID=190308 RepID=A0ABS1T0C3_9GAMM|nr:hypothetical protein [Shewanella schlegeliana]MBL4914233.1 hypothetical protein [Shewanella schlegeliana]MCL1111373.1 hypothetical protein [Shewanella schlegeliana]GIU33976.1 hypothetical protein TUM4433_29430 [Shewanella schlegeliana]
MNKFIKSLFSRAADLEAASEASPWQVTQTEYTFQHHRLFYDGLIQLQIVKCSGFNTELVQQFELLGSSNCDLLLADWIDNGRFIAVDSTGRIYSSDFSSASNSLCSEVRVEANKPGLSAIVSLELYPTKNACFCNGKLWLVGAKQGGRRSAESMYCINIEHVLRRGRKSSSFELLSSDIHCYAMPFRFIDGSMVYLADNEFVFYQREKRRMHQLVSFNPQTSETKVYPLEGKSAPTEISFRNTFFMDNKRGIALLANTETLTLAQPSDNASKLSAEAPSFDFVLQLIDFQQKKTLWSRSVRTLSPSQICADYDAEELVESLIAIAAGDMSSSHHDELQTFIECLTSVTVNADGNSLWLGWQDGVVQQLSLTGECISPLYQIMQVMRDDSLRSVLVFGHEPVVIQGKIDNHLIIAVGEEEDARIWSMELADKQGTPPTKQVESHHNTASECQSLNQKESPANSVASVVCQQVEFSLAMSTRLTEVPSSNGQVDICLQDVNDTKAKVHSLEKLNTLMPKLEAHYLQSDQTSLFFGFVSQQVNGCSIQSEYELFSSAAYDEKGAALLASIIKQFASWPCAAHLSGLKGAPVIANAVLALADKREYLDTLAEYFCAIGSQEPIHPFHVHRTMAVILEQHAGTPELAGFMATVPWPWNDASYTVPNVGDYD